MTALMATFSTVATPLWGSKAATGSPGPRPEAVTMAATEAAVGGSTGRPSVKPRA